MWNQGLMKEWCKWYRTVRTLFCSVESAAFHRKTVRLGEPQRVADVTHATTDYPNSGMAQVFITSSPGWAHITVLKPPRSAALYSARERFSRRAWGPEEQRRRSTCLNLKKKSTALHGVNFLTRITASFLENSVHHQYIFGLVQINSWKKNEIREKKRHSLSTSDLLLGKQTSKHS